MRRSMAPSVASRTPKALHFLFLGCVAAPLMWLLANESSGKGVVTAAVSSSEAFGSLLTVLLVLIQAFASLLPGFAVAVVALLVFQRRSTPEAEQIFPRKRLLGALGGCIILWGVLQLVLLPRRVAAGESRPAGDGRAAAAAAKIPASQLHSGEETMSDTGAFVRLPDPSKPAGSDVDGNWQQSLLTHLTTAIKGGQEQVVIVFSRQACPWCERQLPVIQNAIKKRAAAISAAAGSQVMPATAFVGGADATGNNMLLSPLRVFVLDAGEFAMLTRQFQVDGFPTSMVFGAPGATPLVARGFLNDDQFDELLRAAALAQPEMGDPEGGRGGGRKRRGLFR